MYEGLVKQMRERAGTLYNTSRFYDSDAKDAAILYKAADAIEELSKLENAIPHVCECCIGCELEKKNGGCDHAFVLSPKRAMIYLSKPRWISATEPPKKDGWYQVYAPEYSGGSSSGLKNINGIMYSAFKHGKWSIEVGYYKRPGCVKAWMPLPEPPKEDNHIADVRKKEKET